MNEEKKSVAVQANAVLQELRKVVSGKDRVLVWVLSAILARGHILLEDIPGVGKTTMAMAFSKALQLKCNRVQFTPDVLPSDVTGFSILDQKSGNLIYQPGAVLCNLFLADELNRATSRTQSALLEAMEEGRVTVDGVTHTIEPPFMVIATQNPTGAAGTQLLPDSQMDRFMIRLSMGYPDAKSELAMVMNRQKGDPLKELVPIMDKPQLVALQEEVAKTYVGETVLEYIIKLISATRTSPYIAQGASPRATLSVTALAKAVAQLRGRDYVVPEDVQEVYVVSLAHRLQLSREAIGQNLTAEAVLRQLLGAQQPPKLR